MLSGTCPESSKWEKTIRVITTLKMSLGLDAQHWLRLQAMQQRLEVQVAAAEASQQAKKRSEEVSIMWSSPLVCIPAVLQRLP